MKSLDLILPSAWGALVSILLLGGCAQLPDNSERTESKMITDGDSTRLGMDFNRILEPHPGMSGVYLLRDGLDAYVGRAVLARLAERSIDVQYYMFHQDTVGRLLIKELLAAADRGVRVRFLLDDMYGGEADDVWLALDSHPSFEVRLFNPFVRGSSKKLQFITDLKRVNHRMHSKTYTADNQATVVGGRNIGDEYFNADPNLAFSDRDVMAIGPVVPDVSEQFDEYWNSHNAFPIITLQPEVESMGLDNLRRELAGLKEQEAAAAYIEALKNSALAKAMLNNSAKFSIAEAIVIHDSSEKLTKGEDWKPKLLISQLAPYIQKAKKEYILVSPYFVPGQKGADGLCKLSEQGVDVRVLTNSLVSNDVGAVHTGYKRHRKELLRCGVTLYELNEQLKKIEGKVFTWLPGLSKSSLHAKTMSMDGTVMFVGSFNFDQRSLNINNEIGILFKHPEIVSESSKHFHENIEKVAFRVELVKDEKGKETLRWSGTEDGKEVVFYSEPYAGFWKKLSVNLMRILPIDSML
jgi:putative cardiolipin synthase